MLLGASYSVSSMFFPYDDMVVSSSLPGDVFGFFHTIPHPVLGPQPQTLEGWQKMKSPSTLCHGETQSQGFLNVPNSTNFKLKAAQASEAMFPNRFRVPKGGTQHNEMPAVPTPLT